MKSRLVIAALLSLGVGMFAVGSAMADDQEVLKKAGCNGCHDQDKKKVGPSYKDIGAKYKGKSADAAAIVLAGKPHPKVKASEEDVKAATAAIAK